MRILITAGPTREPLDEVRYLANRSSGRLGLAVAAEALSRGHEVVLLLGRGAVPPPASLEDVCIPFDRTLELQSLLQAHAPDCQLLLMAAAVADFIPEQAPSGHKYTRADGPPQLTLTPAPDLLAQLASTKKANQRFIGWALEPKTSMMDRAAAKLRAKSLDAIVANPLETMDSQDITATLMTSDGGVWPTPGSMTKTAFASWLMDHLDVPHLKI